MNEQNLEVLSIKRSSDSRDGQLLKFLRERERLMSGRGLTKIVLNTLRMCWLPFVLKSQGLDKEQLKPVVLYYVRELEFQITLLKHLLE